MKRAKNARDVLAGWASSFCVREIRMIRMGINILRAVTAG
jgi:hypothetical protein